MFVINEDKSIYTIKHDTAHFTVSIAPYELRVGDILTFTVRKRYRSAVIIATNADEDGYFNIASSDYDGVEPGYYLYDIQLTTGEGEIFTLVPPSPFTIDIEITEEVADGRD